MSPRIRVSPFIIAVAATTLAIGACIAALIPHSFQPKPDATPEARTAASRISPSPVASGFSRKETPSFPLAFERNDGQHASHLRYTARGAGYAFGFTDDGLHVALRTGARARFSMRFRDAHTPVRVSPESPLGGHANYLIGADAERWRTGIPLAGRVRYENVWPGIDAVFYGTERQLEYDVVVAPGVEPSRAGFTFDGVERARVEDDGSLALRVGGRDVTFSAPVAYQDVDGARQQVTARYVLTGATLSFVVGEYDNTRPLVIDPILNYSTYLGGSNGDGVSDVAVDAAGHAYVAGYTTSADFPTTAGAFQQTRVSELDHAFVTKFTADGRAILYSTYIGGNSGSAATAIAVGPDGSAYVAGMTNASDFPTRSPFQPAYHGGPEDDGDAFVLKLSRTGNSLVYSTYLGGWGNDAAHGVAVHPGGEAVVVGSTSAADFPTRNAADNSNPDGSSTGFATKFSRTGTSVIYSTYLTGTDQIAYDVDVDTSGRAYIVGRVATSGLRTTSNAAQPTFGGAGLDGYLVRLSGAGAWQYATYMGGPGQDELISVRVDAAGSAYAAGWSIGGGFPTTGPAFSAAAPGGQDAVLVKVAFSGALTYGTYYGGTGNETAHDVDFDQWGAATITGQTRGTVPLTSDAYQMSAGGAADVFIATISGPDLQYATRVGAGGDEIAGSVAVHATGRITIAGSTSSTGYPLRVPVDSTNTCPDSFCVDGFLTQFAPRTPGTLPEGSAVVYPARAMSLVLSGRWDPVPDGDAAGGVRMENPNAGAPKVVTPLANPNDYFEIPATVVRGQPYSLWVRGRAHNDSYNNDSVYVQFSNAVSSSGEPLWRTGTTSALTIVLEDCTSCGLSGWAWQDAGFGLKVAGPVIPAFAGDVVSIRVQAREDGISIDQIALVPASPDAPGFQKQDATIYPQLVGGGPEEVVIYAGADDPQLHGGWAIAADSTAAGGVRLTHPNAHAPKVLAPLASPRHYVDLRFEAVADTPYFFYLRGKAAGNSPYNDSVYVQLSNTEWAPGTTSALAVNLELCNGVGLSDWGWRDNSWCEPEGNDGGSTVSFAAGGPQTIRIQAREDGISIDQIVFSTTRTQPPGHATDDTTILPQHQGSD